MLRTEHKLNTSDTAHYEKLKALTLHNLNQSQLAQQFLAQGKKHIWILDLGCGKSPGFLALEEYFSRYGIEISYAGVDINSTVIENNETVFADYGNVSFYPANASHPDGLKNCFAPHFADLVFCQHAQVSLPGVLDMLKETLPHYLSADGRVYISCYFSHEMEAILRLQSNECPLFPQDEQKGECCIINNSHEISEHIVYISSVPLKVNQPIKEKKSENTVSAFSLFKKAVNDSLTSLSERCCRRKSQLKQS